MMRFDCCQPLSLHAACASRYAIIDTMPLRRLAAITLYADISLIFAYAAIFRRQNTRILMFRCRYISAYAAIDTLPLPCQRHTPLRYIFFYGCFFRCCFRQATLHIIGFAITLSRCRLFTLRQRSAMLRSRYCRYGAMLCRHYAAMLTLSPYYATRHMMPRHTPPLLIFRC